MISNWPLNENDRRSFEDQGFLYIKNFYSEDAVLNIQKGIYNLFKLTIETYKLDIQQKPFLPETFDSGRAEMQVYHRELLGQVYNAIKKLPCYFELACAPQHKAMAELLLNSNMVGIASRGWGVRMDNPGEDKYLTQLHQDYTSQLCSPSGIVIWSPLRNVTNELGPVKIYPGSHKEGILDIDIIDEGSYGLQVRDPNIIIKKYDPICPEVNVRDAVIIHMLTAHESTPNVGQETRWAMISRYFDFNEMIGRSHGWRGGLQEGGDFASIHPEKSNKRYFKQDKI